MSPARFLFDRDFAAPRKSPELAVEEYVEPTVSQSEHDRLIREAEQRGYEQGRAEENARLTTDGTHKLAAEAARLAQTAAQLLADVDAELQSQEKEAIGLAFLIARRFAGHLIAREPLGEVVALISECLGPLRKSPHVVIRVCERDSDQLKAHTDRIAYEKGYEGRIVILGEPDIARGDCRIEWADGGMTRDRKALEKQIEVSVRRYFATRDGKNRQDLGKTTEQDS